MARTTVVFYISGHGLGHASRELEVINALVARDPSLRIVVRTSAPRWFLESGVRAPIEIEPMETDPGAKQIDSLRLDEEGTARDAARFYAGFDDLVAKEAGVLRTLGASIVVGDIPPLAFASARRAGISSIAIANFTWDWIYGGYPDFDARAPGVIRAIEAGYAEATAALRLPLHGGFEPMLPIVRDIPLIARHSHRSREELRRLLGLDHERPVVLASFGGHGVALRYDAVARANNVTIVVTDHETSASVDGLKRFSFQDLVARGFRYEDLVRAVDVVVGKAGYGIVSECIANRTALLYTDRGRFIEHDVLLAEMPRMLRCRRIPLEELLAGRWEEHVRLLLQHAEPLETPPTNGAQVAADEILARLPLEAKS